MRTLWLMLVAAVGVVLAIGYDTPTCDERQTIVHLFEWKWSDIAAECERFLGQAGYCAVQVSPPMEHVLASEDGYPWWQRYQPVSYQLESRSGTRTEFIDMVQRCNAVGVRIIVDTVINNMAGLGRSGQGSGGSAFNADGLDFRRPYTSDDFTPGDLCPSPDGEVHDYSVVEEVRNCYLGGLTDLYGSREFVRHRISHYLNDLIDIGVMGFRIDAAKHIWPEDLEAIQSLTNNLNTLAGYPGGRRPFFFQDLVDLGVEPITVDEYFPLGRTTEFRFCTNVAAGVEDFALLEHVYDPNSSMAPPHKALVFVDNHQNQRGDENGHVNVLTYKQEREYKMGVTFSLAHDYGFMRVMSSYDFQDSNQGPPGSDNGGSTDTVPINADGTCGGGWICEHRWNAIMQMVMFRNVVAGTHVANWYHENENVAFPGSMTGKCVFVCVCVPSHLSLSCVFFFLVSLHLPHHLLLSIIITSFLPHSLSLTVHHHYLPHQLSLHLTISHLPSPGMPAGIYCDIITRCEKTVTVEDGTARIHIYEYQEPLLAICVGCDGSIPTNSPDYTTTTEGPTPTQATTPEPTLATTPEPTTPEPTTAPPQPNRTVVFLHRETDSGQDVFIIGGTKQPKSSECKSNAVYDPCAIDIEVLPLGTGYHYEKYDAWRVGDTKLDWYGAQIGQGKYDGRPAEGSPLVWTTNDPNAAEYQPLNTFGPHYWMIDLMMYCDQTDADWFELRSFTTNDEIGWEDDINQDMCTGDAGSKAPTAGVYHVARCGYLNVFDFQSPSCEIDNLP
ncbi:alpha-amylase-like [Homarus americanus]|uniref:alpha-amylase-like n=1 Tax=Homarus americanus TaxID=6706 RepID=UPI001C452927|nr:alpha-amylase-like [Homarus americanus]